MAEFAGRKIAIVYGMLALFYAALAVARQVKHPGIAILYLLTAVCWLICATAYFRKKHS